MVSAQKSPGKGKERRNERERNRVYQVNAGFNRLRDRVSTVLNAKKLSKADILKEAMRYIRYLEGILGQDYAPTSPDTQMQCEVSPQQINVTPDQSYYCDNRTMSAPYPSYDYFPPPHHHGVCDHL